LLFNRATDYFANVRQILVTCLSSAR
jgi:hypothetical protein